MPRLKNGGDRRAQILHEATGLFAQHGFDGTSVRAIARACSITEAAIYRHFDHKVHLYEEVIRAKAGQHDIAGNLAAFAGQGTVADVLGRVAEHVLELAADDPQLMRLMFNNTLEAGSVAAVLFREVRLPYIDFLTREIEERMAAGEIRPIEPFITSRCFVGMVMDCALNINVWEEINEDEFQAGDVVCNNVPIFARGLLAPAAAVAGPEPGSVS
jgi:AcrR family transcriptional regulator